MVWWVTGCYTLQFVRCRLHVNYKVSVGFWGSEQVLLLFIPCTSDW